MTIFRSLLEITYICVTIWVELVAQPAGMTIMIDPLENVTIIKNRNRHPIESIFILFFAPLDVFCGITLAILLN